MLIKRSCTPQPKIVQRINITNKRLMNLGGTKSIYWNTECHGFYKNIRKNILQFKNSQCHSGQIMIYTSPVFYLWWWNKILWVNRLILYGTTFWNQENTWPFLISHKDRYIEIHTHVYIKRFFFFKYWVLYHFSP